MGYKINSSFLVHKAFLQILGTRDASIENRNKSSERLTCLDDLEGARQNIKDYFQYTIIHQGGKTLSTIIKVSFLKDKKFFSMKQKIIGWLVDKSWNVPYRIGYL